MSDTNGQAKTPKITLTFSSNMNVSANLENVNPLLLWAAAEWLRHQADIMDEAMRMQQAQSQLDIVRDFPGGLKRG